MERVTVQEAAERLGTTPDAVRSRLRRRKLEGGKDGDTWFVLLPGDSQRQSGDSHDDSPSSCETVNRQSSGCQTTAGDSQPTVTPEPAPSMAILQEQLESARAMLALTQEQLAVAQDQVRFFQERMEQKDAIISQLAEAQVEALKRRDILEAHTLALPEESEARAEQKPRRSWWARLFGD